MLQYQQNGGNTTEGEPGNAGLPADVEVGNTDDMEGENHDPHHLAQNNAGPAAMAPRTHDQASGVANNSFSVNNAVVNRRLDAGDLEESKVWVATHSVCPWIALLMSFVLNPLYTASRFCWCWSLVVTNCNDWLASSEIPIYLLLSHRRYSSR